MRSLFTLRLASLHALAQIPLVFLVCAAAALAQPTPTPSTVAVAKDKTTNVVTGNIVIGNNTTLTTTGNGTITANLSAAALANTTLSGNTTVTGPFISATNLTLTPGSGNTHLISLGNLVTVERRYSGDRWPQSYPTGESGSLVVRNPTTGAEFAFGEYAFGQGLWFDNPHHTFEMFGKNDSATPFYNPVLTLISAASGPIAQIRNIGDTNSMVFTFPLNGTPTITTEQSGTDLKISPQGNIILTSQGSSKAVRVQTDINRVGPSNTSRPINFRTAASESDEASTRFALVLGATPEDMSLNRHDDSGNYVSPVWLANRSNGNFTVTQNLIAGSITSNTTLTASTALIRNSASGATANTGANTLVVDSIGQTGLSLLGTSTQYTTLFMGDTVDNQGFRMYYGGTSHATTADRSTWQVFTGGVLRMRMNSISTNLTVPLSVTGNITASGAIIPSGGTRTWTSGSGSPEGAVTAPVGSLYSRTDGGAGTSFYVKESGTGNTGWVAK